MKHRRRRLTIGTALAVILIAAIMVATTRWKKANTSASLKPKHRPICTDEGLSNWTHRRFTSAELVLSQKLAGSMDSLRLSVKCEGDKSCDSSDQTWYARVDFAVPRYQAVGFLIIAKYSPNSEEWSVERNLWRCTAFYVAPSILATAAHCLREHGLTSTSRHVLIFRQQFDASKPYSRSIAAQYERTISEIIYGTNTGCRCGDWRCGSNDIAFLSTTIPSYNGIYYKLESLPDSYRTTGGGGIRELELVGYPVDHAPFSEAASVYCKPAGASDRICPASNYKLEKCFDDNIRNHYVFCVTKSGRMGGGGSGGPWLLTSEESGAFSDQGAKAVAVGVSSAVKSCSESSPNRHGPLANAMDLFRLSAHNVSVSVWLGKAVLDLYDIISKVGPEEPMWQTIVEACYPDFFTPVHPASDFLIGVIGGSLLMFFAWLFYRLSRFYHR